MEVVSTSSWEAILERLDDAAEVSGVDPEIHEFLRLPKRVLEVSAILASGEADMVGIGRPFYAEPDLPARILGGSAEPALCRNSNHCVPPQMLGMKGVCYNPEVKKARAGAMPGTGG
jgi:hypothetical protein